MSLIARIEAVIYAAEEPVTLAQLTAVFRDEALALRDSRIVQQNEVEASALAAFTAEPALAELALVESEIAEMRDAAADPSAQPETLPAEPPAALSASAPSASDSPESSPDDAAKRAARSRDREARDEIRRVVDELIAGYASADRGLEIREIAGGFRMATRAECHDAVRAFVRTLKPPMKLSLQALETLAVIAYKQPVTAPEIGEIRGVDSAGVLGSLIARKLITTAGRKQVIGRPILYKTTKEFLLRFGLKELSELPSLEEFEKVAGELAESDEEAAATASTEAELPFTPEEAETAASPEAPAAAPDTTPSTEHTSARDPDIVDPAS
jgi:segregation and condensation protein B